MIYIYEFSHNLFLLIGLVDSEICQLSAVVLDNKESPPYNQYVLPRNGISQRASQANKLSVTAGQLLYKSVPAQSINLKECLATFLSFLKQQERRIIMVAYNNKVFDSRILTRAFLSNNQYEVQSIVVGFVDTLPLFKSLLPGKRCYKQDYLVKDCMNVSYDAHNGLEDVKALRDLLVHLKPWNDAFCKHSFSLDYVLQSLDHHQIFHL